jgi:hypothetical protein
VEMEEGSGFAGAGSGTGTGTGEHSSMTTMGAGARSSPRTRTSSRLPPAAWSDQPAEGGDAGIGENPVQETCAGGRGLPSWEEWRMGGGGR